MPDVLIDVFTNSETPAILRYVVVSRTGHPPLGSNCCSRGGVMHLPWNRSQVERASRGALLLTHQEAEKMLGQASRRLAAAEQNLAGLTR